jgi:hypothetical protein
MLSTTRLLLSRHAAGRPGSTLFRPWPQGRPRLIVRAAGQRDQAGGGQGSLLDRHVGLLLKEAQKRACRDPRRPAGSFRATRIVTSSVSTRLSWSRSFAAASAESTFRHWEALWKIA